MIDFNNLWIGIECPNCKYSDEVQLIDVKSEREFYCHNCKRRIQLNDYDGSVHNGIENLNYAMKNLLNVFKQFGK